MKICLLHIVDAPEQLGGAERVVLTLAREFARDPSMEVAAALNKGRLFNEIKDSNVKAYPLPRKGILNIIPFYLALIRMIRDFKPDVVHSHHRYTTLLAQVLPFRPYKLVHTFHLEQFTRKWNKFFGDYQTAVSEGCKGHFVKYFGQREDSIEVIYNGVYSPSPRPAPLGAGSPERDGVRGSFYMKRRDGVTASVIGRLTEQKGHAVLLNALSNLPDFHRKKLKIFFVGDGEKREEIEREISGLGLKENIIITGWQDDVYPYIMASDFTILPSLWEGFGLAIVESYLCARPVIGSRVGGIPELVIDNVAGVLVPPDNSMALKEALLYFINNPEVVKRYGEAGKKIALERFTVEKMVDNYKNFYGQIISR